MNIPARYLTKKEWQAHSATWDLSAKKGQQDTSFLYLNIKRLLDLSIAFFVIICFCTWLLPILCLIIVIESKGMPVFTQKRTGKNGKTFTCYKLRTMRVNPEANTKQATPNDERITRIGNFLRLSSLDELPQFLNVLMGHMSLVGPRPHMVYHTDYYGVRISGYALRHKVKPGITGLAQIRGFRGPTKELKDMENRLNADLYYVAHQNLNLDLRIISATAHEVWASLNARK